MVLTGLSFLTLLSLQTIARPLFGKRYPNVFGDWFCRNVAMLLFNMRRFTADFIPFIGYCSFKNNRKAANGWPWIVIAIVYWFNNSLWLRARGQRL